MQRESRPRFSTRRMLVPSLLSLIAPLAVAAEFEPIVPPPAPVTPAPAPAPASTGEGQALVVTGEEDKGFAADNSNTATKLDLSLQDTPQTVVVVSKELIQSQGFFSLRDALRNVPGLTMTAGENSRTGDRLNIRGYSAQNDMFSDGLRDNGQFFRDTFNLQQVEVLKGPSGILFGRGSTGGVVNSVSKDPDKEWTADGSVTLGSYNFYRLQAGGGGPLIEDVMGGRIDAFYQDNESFRDEQHTKRFGVAPTVSFDLSPTSKLTLNYFRQIEDSTTDYGIPSFNGAPANVDISTYYGFKDDAFYESDARVYTARLTTQVSELFALRNSLRFGEYVKDYRTEPMGAITFNAGNPDASTIARAQQLWDVDQRNLIGQSELVFKGKVFNRDLTAVAGAEFAVEHYDVHSRTSSGTPAISIFHPNSPSSNPGKIDNLHEGPVTHNETHTSTVSSYVLLAYEFVETWTAIAGFRGDRFAASYRSGVINYDTGVYTPNAYGSDENVDNMLSPRLALTWEPNDDVTAYVSYGTSFNPSAESYQLSATTGPVSPEKTNSYELGAKASLLDQYLSISGAIYRVDKVNERTNDPTTPTDPNVLTGHSRADGFELGAEGKVTEKLNVFAGASFTQTEVIKSNNFGTPTPTYANPTPVANSEPIEGKELVNVPEFAGNVWATYALPWNLTAGGGVFYVGERWGDNVNTIKIPDYFRVDLGIAWGDRLSGIDWFAQANIFNVTDEEYYDGFGSGNRINPGAPVSGQLTLGARF